MRADHDLPWYFGTGSRTLAGDAGLQSTTGSQIAHLQASQLSDDSRSQRTAAQSDPWRRLDDPRWSREAWQRNPHPPSSVDASRVEDSMIERTADVAHAGEVEERLGSLSALHQRALRLHYSAESLPFGVDPAAALLDSARRACQTTTTPTSSALREALKELSNTDRDNMVEEAKAVVLAAQVAYENAHVHERRRVQVNDPRTGRR